MGITKTDGEMKPKTEKSLGNYDVTIDMVKRYNEAKNSLEKIQVKTDELEVRKQNLIAQVEALKAQITDLSGNQDKLLDRINKQIAAATKEKQEEFDKLEAALNKQQQFVDDKVIENEKKGKNLDRALAEAINAKKNYEKAQERLSERQVIAEDMIARFNNVIDVIKTSLKG